MNKPDVQPSAPNKRDENENEPVDSATDDAAAPRSRPGFKQWLLRYGAVGLFLFFLIKGLIWIAVAVIAWWSVREI